MSKRDKLRRKLRNNPKGVRYEDLKTLLLRFDFRLERISGSHHVFEYKVGKTEGIFVVPVHTGGVKTRYIEDAIKLLDQLFPEQEAADESEDSDDE